MVSSTTQSQVLHQSRVRTSKLFQTEQSYKSGWFTPPISAKIEDCYRLFIIGLATLLSFNS